MFADEFLGREKGADLKQSGVYSRIFFELAYLYIKSKEAEREEFSWRIFEKEMSALVASIFWRTFIACPAYVRELARAVASPLAVKASEPFIIRHGENSRYDLIVFDPYYVHD